MENTASVLMEENTGFSLLGRKGCWQVFFIFWNKIRRFTRIFSAISPNHSNIIVYFKIVWNLSFFLLIIIILTVIFFAVLNYLAELNLNIFLKKN